MNIQELTNQANGALLGRKVTAVRYLTEVEQQAFKWHLKCVVLEFDDGSMVFPSVDDEGTEAGSLQYYKDGKVEAIPAV